ncbi:Peroxiredoxin-4 [Chionoecetes opilio]|uniref:thioredoxin-dependent peroxiredoxin n=1 Tax=Chionoecetes opilio TaxID=41210 RepID=A0A8J8WNG0_CHIOP|nr:Peroxiredoxin-4 [Chionoecetes opilio]
MSRFTPWVVACVAALSVACNDAEEQCHTFAGGAVYPNTEGRASGHNLQWTSAMISKPAPVWEGTAVIDGQFQELKLSDYRGKYMVFFFYPMDFTFVCPTEILAFNDRVEEFRALNTEVVACSIDSHFTHLAWTNTQRKIEDCNWEERRFAASHPSRDLKVGT